MCGGGMQVLHLSVCKLHVVYIDHCKKHKLQQHEVCKLKKVNLLTDIMCVMRRQCCRSPNYLHLKLQTGVATRAHRRAILMLLPATVFPWPWLGVSGGQCTSPAENIAVSYHLAVRIVPFHPHKDMLRKCVFRTPQI